MKFLPLTKDGGKVYAGFWKRLAAGIIDLLVWLPFIFIFHYVQSISIVAAMIATIIFYLSFSIYNVCFNLKYGGSLGKLAVRIRVTKPNGQKISLEEALLRSSVEIVFSVFFAVTQVYAISNVEPESYLKAGFIERTNLILPLIPAYGNYADILNNIWYWSEMIVLLFNKRKRALHDFIAGTVVINKVKEVATGIVATPNQCPHCSGAIIEEAVTCKHCGVWLKSYNEMLEDKLPSTDYNDEAYPDEQKNIYKYTKIALILSLIWLAGLGSIIGIIYSRKALKIIKASPNILSGKGMAIFSMILGIIGVSFWGVVAVGAIISK